MRFFFPTKHVRKIAWLVCWCNVFSIYSFSNGTFKRLIWKIFTQSNCPKKRNNQFDFIKPDITGSWMLSIYYHHGVVWWSVDNCKKWFDDFEKSISTVAHTVSIIQESIGIECLTIESIISDKIIDMNRQINYVSEKIYLFILKGTKKTSKWLYRHEHTIKHVWIIIISKQTFV